MAREIKTKAKKFALDDSPMIAENERILENGGVAQPATPAPQPTREGLGEGLPGEGLLVLKNVGAKIPYSVYDRLERIKRQSERSGIKSEKRNIGDLIAQAIKEFVEKYDVQ